MSDKPIIRHCKNCKWQKDTCGGYCTVKYQLIEFDRLKALFCRFYKKKGAEENE